MKHTAKTMNGARFGVSFCAMLALHLAYQPAARASDFNIVWQMTVYGYPTAICQYNTLTAGGQDFSDGSDCISVNKATLDTFVRQPYCVELFRGPATAG